MSEKNMTLMGHMHVLRKSLVRILLIYVVFALVCFYYVNTFFHVFLDLGKDYNFIYTNPSDIFMLQFRFALLGGLVVASPFIIMELWNFIKFGLKDKEKKIIRITFFFGLIFFLCGAFFAYYVLIPSMLTFFISLDIYPRVNAAIDISSFVNMIIPYIFVTGLIFEIPIVVSILAIFNLIKTSFLTKRFREIIVVLFIVAAVVTPTTDIFNMLIMVVPLIFLYGLSILLCMFFSKKKEKKEKKEEVED